MRKRNQRGWALLLIAALLAGTLPAGNAPVSKAETTASAANHGLKNPIEEGVSPPKNTSHGLSNPRNENGTVTWDCVYFGNYWQNDTNGDGVVNKNDEKEPIKWRVLSVDEDDAFLLADKKLNRLAYNDTNEAVTWETCTMRSWLNGYGADENVCGKDYSDNNFLDNAFTESEQAAIKVTDVVNEVWNYGFWSENITQDKVYLLSLSEVMNPEYGFTSTTSVTYTRGAVNTAYVGEGLTSAFWWLREPVGRDGASTVNDFGQVFSRSRRIDYTYDAARPVLHLNLSSSEWKKVETVSADGGETTSTWDCVYFGNYWQNDTNGDGKADKNDEKEPIKWRVLSVDGDDAFLLADKNLDGQSYNDTAEDVTWETCTMRSWLNGYGADKNVCGTDYSENNFLDNAFTESEQAAIKVTDVVNEDGTGYVTTEGGNDTQDKVYLLSLNEVSWYGLGDGDKRKAVNTAYYGAAGESAGWWLRSLGWESYYASYVSSDGSEDGGCSVRYYNAVRPALHLNLSSAEWIYAGTVSSTGEEDERPASNPAPSAAPTPTPGSGIGTTPGDQSPIANSGAGTTVAAAPSASPQQSVQPQTTASPKVKIGKVSGLKVKAKKKAVQASWKKVSGADGYEVQVSTSKKFTKKSVKTTKKTKLTISKLKAKKKYFVRVRAYCVTDGKKTYGKWSKTANRKTKA